MPKSAPDTGVPKTAANPAADAADDQPPPILVVQAEDVGEEARDRRSDLGARPFFPDGASERERENRREQLDRRDLRVDLPGSLVDGGDDGFRAVPPGGGREGSDEPDADGQGEGSRK